MVDFEGTMHRLGGDVDLFQEFICVFDEDAPRSMEDIRRAVADRDAAKLELAAHTLRGLVSNFGAQSAAGCAFRLEQMALSGQMDGAGDALAQLEQELFLLNDALDALLRAMAVS